MALSDMSSNAENDDSQSEDNVESNGNGTRDVAGFENGKLLNESELPKRAVLASSDNLDDENEDKDDSDAKAKDKKKKQKGKKEETKKEKVDDETKEQKKKVRSDPSFLRVKLSESDSDLEEEKARYESFINYLSWL
jgi:hypothetical protein